MVIDGRVAHASMLGLQMRGKGSAARVCLSLASKGGKIGTLGRTWAFHLGFFFFLLLSINRSLCEGKTVNYCLLIE